MSRVAAAFTLLAVGCGRATAFPISVLEVSQSHAQALNSTAAAGKAQREGLATQLLLPSMQDIFRKAHYAISIEKGDIIVQASFPDTQVDGSCNHAITAQHPKATGDLEKTSSLRFGVANVSWHGLSIFADSEVDASLDINTDVKVEVGKHIFGHHCSHFGRKTVGIDVKSDGHTGIGISLTAYNAHLAHVNGTWSLVFDFSASVFGTVIHWNVEKVHADNCKINILGIEIASVCGTIERHVKDKAQALVQKAEVVQAPKLLRKLQDKLNTAIGSQVVIPLKIAAEHEEIIV